MQNRGRIVVGISGRGHLLQSLLTCQENHTYTVSGVFSSSPYAAGLRYAHAAKLPSLVLSFNNKDVVEQLHHWMMPLQIDGIILAGFTRHFPQMPGFEPRTISMHPSLLPDFGGKGMFGHNVHKAVFAARRRESGATVHLVTDGYDEGRIIAQITVDISECSDVAALQEKIFTAECLLYPRTIDFLITNNWQTKPALQYEMHPDGSCARRADQEDKYDLCG